MAKLASKHENMSSVVFGDFTGGLNLTRPVESLGDNEMAVADNFEFGPDTGSFKVRAGLSLIARLPADVKDVFPVAGTDTALVRAGDRLYRLSGTEAVMLRLLTEADTGKGTFEYWGDNNGVVMAFGGGLYLYDAETDEISVPTDSNAPTQVSTLFYRDGRLAVVESSTDDIRFSGVGDPFMWTEDPDDASTAKILSVGYKDGCALSAVGELGGDLIAFKAPPGQPEHGRIYRVQGLTPDWTVGLYSKGNSAWNQDSVVTLADDLIFITRVGVASLATTDTYGDFRLNWPGAKVNTALSQVLTDRCRLWLISPRGQIWLATDDINELYIYHYQMQAWTKFFLPGPVADMAVVSGRTYVAIGAAVYEFNDAIHTDYAVADDGLLVMRDINAVWVPKTTIRRNQILTKMVMANHLSTATARATLIVEGLRVPLLPSEGRDADIAATDFEIAATDVDLLSSGATSVTRKRCQFVRWSVTPRLEVANGLFSMSSVVLEIAEV
jgi:hypothetical protein